MGASGSCACSTSKPPRRTKRSARAAAAGDSATGATDPLECSAMGRPMTKCSPAVRGTGTPSSAGPTTVTSWPDARRERARPNAWPCTPPGRVSA